MKDLENDQEKKHQRRGKKGRNWSSSSKSNVYSKNDGELGSYNQDDKKIVLTLPVNPFSHWIQLACQTAAEKKL